jgi:hypothetical protein
MNDIRRKDVDTYVRNLISEKFKSRRGATKGQHKDKVQKLQSCSRPKSENPAANPKDNSIGDSF